jgi:hypothetical protein
MYCSVLDQDAFIVFITVDEESTRSFISNKNKSSQGKADAGLAEWELETPTLPTASPTS